MKSINPFNNELIKEYQEYNQEEVEQIIRNADEAYRSWRNSSFDERSVKMKKAAEILLDNKQQYGELISTEMGKIIKESVSEVEKCAWVCNYYADNAKKFLADEPIETDAAKSMVSFEPLGVVLSIMPWNFPFWQVFRFAAPTIMAGNAGLLKHASNVSGCSLEIEKIFKEAGFPDNLFRSLLVPGSKVDEVIQNPLVKAVTLTGSEGAGRSVAKTAGAELKKTVLELGGSDPFIVLKDADLKASVETAVTARMINTGQSCIAAKRFIVVDEIADKFEKMTVRRMQKITAGNPFDEASGAGPLAKPEFVDDIIRQVSESVEQGAEILLGGNRRDRKGNFFEPTVLKNVTPGMPAFDEETFGPVFSIVRVNDEKEAIDMANKSSFGLGGALWTKDVEHGERLARLVETGAIFVNGMTKSDPRMPFGGIKNSGYGRELSHYGIREFVNIKSISIA